MRGNQLLYKVFQPHCSLDLWVYINKPEYELIDMNYNYLWKGKENDIFCSFLYSTDALEDVPATTQCSLGSENEKNKIWQLFKFSK